ncbi:MAG: xanthine dehydrogenase accessory protein XdhC [Usitatibacter sp.]
MRDWLQALHDELKVHGAPVVRVVVAVVRGSAPREPGACMLVSSAGELGTIGGGHLEFVATRSARDLLDAGSRPARLDRFSLGASLGQCCGGIVELWFQRYEACELAFLAQALHARAAGEAAVMATSMEAESAQKHRWLSQDAALREGAHALDGGEGSAVVVHHASGPTLYELIVPREVSLWLFGAGHVAKALVNVLAPLPFGITWIDSREGMLPAGSPGHVRCMHSAHPGDEVPDMDPGAWALVMTHSHDEDFSVCEALLEDGRFAWAGVIGSQPKATRFRQRLVQRGYAREAVARLAMPIGIDGIRSKAPAAIAVAVAAQLLQLREARTQREDATPARAAATVPRES